MSVLTDYDELTPVEDIFDEARGELDYARGKWGREADKFVNLPMDWAGFITHYATRWFPGGFRPYSRETLAAFRTSMLKVISIAVSAIQETDLILDGRNARPDVFATMQRETERQKMSPADWVLAADELAMSESPDPSRKTACLIINEATDKAIAWGVNSPPRGIAITEDRLKRPAKYGWLPHAESAAIAMAASRGRATKGRTAVLNWFPCHSCAINLIGAGVSKVICLEPNWEDENYSFKPAREALEEAGVKIVFAGAYQQGERKPEDA